jgi:tripartite-type tricarboxylate transporter receptor subunit TctC
MAGTFGKQISSDICRLLLNKFAGIDLVNVPFKSSSEEITALLGGHIDVAFISSPGPHLESKTIRILAIAEKERVPVLPDIPTYSEYGYPVLLAGAYTLCFPKGTPQEVVDRFFTAQKKAIQQHEEEIKEDLKKVEQFGTFLTPEETQRTFLELRRTVMKIAKELGVEP